MAIALWPRGAEPPEEEARTGHQRAGGDAHECGAGGEGAQDGREWVAWGGRPHWWDQHQQCESAGAEEEEGEINGGEFKNKHFKVNNLELSGQIINI